VKLLSRANPTPNPEPAGALAIIVGLGSSVKALAEKGTEIARVALAATTDK